MIVGASWLSLFKGQSESNFEGHHHWEGHTGKIMKGRRKIQ